MIGRREFGFVGLSAALAVPSVLAAGKGADDHAGHDDEAKHSCAKACSDCQRACDRCATHCAGQLGEGKKQHATTLATCQDCADFCAAAAQIVSRGGPFAVLLCEACAKACAQCGKECEKFPDDRHMAECAKECRRCETACREMVKHAERAV